MDIRDFKKKEDLPEELYHLDILDGSPPCTTFSYLGDRDDALGKKKKFAEGQSDDGWRFKECFILSTGL